MTVDRPPLRSPPAGPCQVQCAAARSGRADACGQAAARPACRPKPRRTAWQRLAHALAGAAIALLARPAAAVGLGDIDLRSHLGEPLRATVRLTGEDAGQMDAGCFRLAPAAEDDLPAIGRARVSVERAGDAAILRLATREAVHHPIAVLAVRVGCGAELTRRYVLLLSPPEIAPPVVAERSTRTATTSAGQDPDAAERGAPVSRARTAAALDRGVATTRPRSPRSNAKPRPAAASARSGPMQDRLSVSGGEPAPLRLATFLGEAGRPGGTELSEAERSLLRTEQRLLQALEDKIVEELSLADKIRRLEAVLADLRGSLAQGSAESPTAAAEPRPPLAAPAPGETTSSVTAPANRVDGAAAAPAGGRGKPEAAAPVEPTARRDLLLFAAIAAAVALLVGLLTRRRRQAERFAEFQAEPVDTSDEAMVTPEEEYQATVRYNRPIIEAAARAPAQAHELDTMAQPLPVQAPDIDVSEHESAMELAEIMLSFGRVKGAAQTLADYIEHNPRQAVEPWLRLLDVYRGAGMRAEWETLARRLNQTFNVEVPQWDGASLSPAAQALEDYPHVVARLTEIWPGPQALEYLNQLLKDTRNGTRAGFPVAVLNEILMLVAVLEAERPAPAADPPAEVRPESPLRAVG